MCMSGVSVSNDLMNMLTIFCLAILLHDGIIDWRYFADDILLAIFLPYTASTMRRAFTA